MKNRLLLTGADGFIGSHFLEHALINTDWEIVCVCSWSHKGTPERVEEILKGHEDWKERVTIITHDLSVPFPERTKKRIGEITYIVNFASDSHVDRSIEDPVPFIQNNVNVMLTMLEFARECKPKFFVQISTDEVYGVAPEGINHKEWSPIVPSNPYSASKAAQEAIAISYWRTYGVPLVITNTMNNFGERQDPEKYVPMLIRKINNGEEVTIHGSKDKIGSRFYLHARNHADAVLYILTKRETDWTGHSMEKLPTKYSEMFGLLPDRYNVVGEREIDNLTLARMVAGILSKPLKYHLEDFHATRPGHDRRYALDGTKLKELGWSAPMPLEDSLRKYINWTLKRDIWL